MYSIPARMEIAPRRVGANSRQSFEIGERAESDIDFAGRAAEFVALDAFDEIGGEVLGFHKGKKRVMGIDAGGDDVAADFFAGLEGDACGAAVLVENFCDGGVGANFDAQFACGGGDRVGDRASATAAEAPRAECAVDFAHVMMEENVGGAGRTNAEKRADDARGGHGGFRTSVSNHWSRKSAALMVISWIKV